MSPSEKLAAAVLQKLVAERLIAADEGKKLAGKLAAGTMKTEDWRLPIETQLNNGVKP